MSDWLARKVLHIGSVWFPSVEPPGPDGFAALASRGIAATPVDLPEMAWALELRHGEWGRARVACPTSTQSSPDRLVPFLQLSEADKSTIARGRSCLTVALDAPHHNVLHERKNLMRFLSAIAGSEAVAVIEPTSMRLWTMADLADELAHDAEFDIEALYSVHSISGDSGECEWIHTHGLVALGGFDFDLVQPEAGTDCVLYPDAVRALAALLLEDITVVEAPLIPLASPDVFVRFIPTAQVLSEGTGEGAQRLRRLVEDDDGSHIDGHAVVCEAAPATGWRRWLRRDRVEVARAPWSRFPSAARVLYPDALTRLMETRARATYDVLRRLHEEFASLGVRTAVKLGYSTDDGDSREHLWFAVEACLDDSILATLVNQPYAVAGLKQGDRARHPIELLTDWVIHTPVGEITPRSQAVARMVRERPDEIRAEIQLG